MRRLADRGEPGTLGELCMSSKSVIGLDKQNSLQRSSIEFIGNAQPADPYKDGERWSDGKNGDGPEKYSPIWSSVNRKRQDSKGEPVKVQNCKAEVTSFPGMNMAPIAHDLSR